MEYHIQTFEICQIVYHQMVFSLDLTQNLIILNAVHEDCHHTWVKMFLDLLNVMEIQMA